MVVKGKWDLKSVGGSVSGLVLLDCVNLDKASNRRQLEVRAAFLVWDSPDDGLLGRDVGEEVTGRVCCASELAVEDATGISEGYNEEVKRGRGIDFGGSHIGGIPGAARVPPI